MIPALRESGADVVAVASRDPERAASYAAKNDIRSHYSDVSDLIADPAVEAVYISSTNDLHHRHVLEAAHAGKHVLCEKPMATSLFEANEMIAACDVAGVVLAVNHHMRNAPTLRAMKRMLDEGMIGQPLAVRIAHVMLLPEFLRTWRTSQPEAGGGVLFDLTTHDVDTLRFLLADEVAEVVAFTASQLFGIGVEDTAMGVMRLRGGVIVSFHDAYTIGSSPTSLEIHGTEGSLIGTEVFRQDPIGEVVLRRGDLVSQVDVGERSNLYVRGIRQFNEAVAGKGRTVVTGEDGLRSLEVALAAAESARTATAVKIGGHSFPLGGA